jgi:hypothetical protein
VGVFLGAPFQCVLLAAVGADAIRRLWVALGSAENSSSEERAKSKWRRFAERILFDSAAQAMVTGGQAAITLAIDAAG